MLARTLAALLALSSAGLPTPPPRVVFQARLGDVELRHDRHLERRASCRACHGDGPVGKVELDKDRGHAVCVGCHKEQGGPTACSGCHDIQGQGAKQAS
jgi:cytochrome c553